MSKKVFLSVIIPLFNEEKNIEPLYLGLKRSLSNINGDFEIIFVNDGSTDRSEKILKAICQKDRRVRIISHRLSLGKAAALGSGFEWARGSLIVVIDADLQDDPQEIPKLIKKISQGYDLVTGWRIKRRDAPLKIFSSRMMNFLVSFFSGLKLHDFYCGLKCYRQETVKKLDLYGELYRLIPLVAYQKGLRIAEVPVHHHHRQFGQSKYGGLRRFKRAVSDLATILWVIKYRRLDSLVFRILGFALVLGGLTFWRLGYLIFGIILVALGVALLTGGLIVSVLTKRQKAKEEKRSHSLKERLLKRH